MNELVRIPSIHSLLRARIRCPMSPQLVTIAVASRGGGGGGMPPRVTPSQGVTPRGKKLINFVGKMVKRQMLWVKWLKKDKWEIWCDKLHVSLCKMLKIHRTF